MKLVIAVINRDDANSVSRSLSKYGFSSTRLATTGGFLRAGNVTLLVGVDEEKEDEVLDIIRRHSHSRREMIPAGTELTGGLSASTPVEVCVGGATIFVVDVQQFERV